SGATEFERQLQQELKAKGVALKGGQTMQAAGTFVMVIAVVYLLWGAAAIAGGVGLIGRKQWGRLLTLILAGVAALLPRYGLIQIGTEGAGALVGVVVYGFYAVFGFVVLLNPARGREFA